MRRFTLLLTTLAMGMAFAPGPAPADPVVAARQRFFGLENVDPRTGDIRQDRAIFSWFGVTNFAAALNGHVVLLDAWVPRGEYSGYSPTSPDELAALEPEAIFIGHSHFDHAADASAIAAASSAAIVGTPEHCDQIRRQAPAGAMIECVDAVERGAAVGAQGTLDGLLSGVDILALKHVHSAAEPPDTTDPHLPAGAPPDPTVTLYHLPAPQDTEHLARHLADGENGTLLYRFEIGNLSVVWHDSSGPLKEVAPKVLQTLAGLPPTDVQMGAIMGFNQVTNGFRDPRMYVEAIRPTLYVPTHHDNWAPPITTRGENYEPILRDELSRIPPERRPIVRFISDPQDYVRPEVLTFDVEAEVWE